MNSMTLLCRTPSPRATESLFGFVLRVSEQNGYDTPRHIWSIAGLPRGSERAARFPTDPIAAILGLDPEALRPLAYRENLEGRVSFKILGHPLGESLRNEPLRLKYPGFCAQCVCETGYIDAFWDLSAAIACPVHDRLALFLCPGCGQRIGWERVALITCRCGASLADTQTPSVPPPVLDLMRFLHARLHRKAVDVGNPSGLPLDHLVAMPFSVLLHLISVLGAIAAPEIDRNADPLPSTAQPLLATAAVPAALSSPQGCPTSQVVSAAQMLSDWPRGYHQFLRKLGERNLASGRKVVGMRKQFASFYETLFKNRPAAREHIAFLRDEFIAFGLEHWGKGIVDPRMLRDKSVLKGARFVSRSELARRHRLWAPTVRKMTESGALAGITVNMKGVERAVVDARNTPIPPAITKICDVRQAAKRLGLTVRVLKRLREKGIYQAIHRRGYASSWIADEIATFRSQLLALTPASLALGREGAVTLNEVVRRSTLPVDTRVAVVSALLEGALKPSGRSGAGPGSILLDKHDIDAFISSNLELLLGSTYSFEECAHMAGLCRSAIAQAIESRHLVQAVVKGHKRVTAESVKRFQSTYLPLAAVARENGVSSRLLVKLSRNKHLGLIFIARANQDSPQGFISRSAAPQLTTAVVEYLADLAAHRQRGDTLALYEDRLRTYCARAIEGRQGLPRKGGVPVKRVIARECGFNRDVFYDQPRIQRLLDEFDRKEREVNKGRCLRPAEAVGDYLAKLKQAGTPLPCWHGRPNVLRIAKQCGIHRHAIERNSGVQRLLNNFARQNSARTSTRR